ncbi:MAG: arabinogalactan endo-1,4-beta-galactosidase [Muribaculaceae bacterium]|nr:arabinogalactan endo-1,4-beta-galactosidase [Muribaculaceae bacterium]
MKFSKILLSAALAMGLAALQGCTQDSPVTNPPVDKTPVEIERGTFAKGADVSWLTQFEARGYKWQNADGVQKELMTLLRDDCGVNAIRLRVWVNPENDAEVQGWCNTDDFMVKARRANALGLRLMVDFHFSDTWADPGKQYMPAAWAELDLDGVLAAMTDHVNSVMTALQREGIEPEWVQIGNETRTGMMWPMGSIDSGDNFTRMVNAGYDAVKAVFPEALVIVHCDCGDRQGLYDRLFGKLNSEGARYDMIGMSLYPEDHNWEQLVDDCVANARYCRQTFGKPVMVCEIGMAYDKAEIADKMMRKLYEAGKAIDLKGIFWWEPETPVGSNGYGKGCVDAEGVPTAALSVFVNE